MKVIIDRFEENIAVVELDGEMLNAPRALFSEAREGDTVEITVLDRARAASQDALTEAYSAEKRLQTVENTRDSFLRSNKEIQDRSGDNPAAIFAKLRRKKKRSGK